MNNWEKILVELDTPLGETIRRIDDSAIQIALVVDHKRRLLGIVTDGDIRRALLDGHSIEFKTAGVMNPHPLTLHIDTSPEEALSFMRRHSVHHVPLVDTSGVLGGVYFIDELIGVVKQPNIVILMAGGLGTRLRPLTESCPKPMLPVGGTPILERIIERFVKQGFEKFYISVNYMAEMIMSHFGDGGKWGVSIEYLLENERLGTAGALSLLPERPDNPFIVMNGDLLTEADFVAMLHEHTNRRVLATMAVREYEMQIPYGVVNVDAGYISSIKEKPHHKFLVNAGIYVLEPEVLDHLPQGHVDMTALFDRFKGEGKALAYSLREYWVDIGRLEDLEAVQFMLQP